VHLFQSIASLITSLNVIFSLYIGVYFASSTRGRHRPIMNLHERSLSVLACRYVDEVIIGAPWDISKDMVNYLSVGNHTNFHIRCMIHLFVVVL
jgi:hypothetical protein